MPGASTDAIAYVMECSQVFTVSLSAQRPLGMGEGAFAQSLALGGSIVPRPSQLKQNRLQYLI